MIIVIVAIDQISKYFAKTYLYGREAKTFIRGIFELVYTENTGVAFSMLSGGRIFFVILTSAVIIFCLIYMYKGRGADNLWRFWSLGVIVSGALGNLIDRIYLGYVIDFINPVFVHFAVFNIADCAVTLGAVSFIAYLLFDFSGKKKGENKDEQ